MGITKLQKERKIDTIFSFEVICNLIVHKPSMIGANPSRVKKLVNMQPPRTLNYVRNVMEDLGMIIPC